MKRSSCRWGQRRLRRASICDRAAGLFFRSESESAFRWIFARQGHECLCYLLLLFVVLFLQHGGGGYRIVIVQA